MLNYRGKPISLSHSAMLRMADCPRCFWIQYHKGIRRPGTPFPSLPAGMDKAIKLHFDRFRGTGKLPPELDGKIDVSLFEDSEKLEEWRNNRKGLRFEHSSGITLMGAVDDMLVHDGKLVVLDYKTRGYPIKEDTHQSYHDQMNVYSFLLGKNDLKPADFAYLLYYHPDGFSKTGSFKFNTDIVMLQTEPKSAEKRFLKAVKLLQGKEPKPSAECAFCNVLNSSE